MSSCQIVVTMSLGALILTTGAYWIYTNRLVKYLKSKNQPKRSFVPFDIYWYPVPENLSKDRSLSLVFLFLSTLSIFLVAVAFVNYC